MESCLHIVKKVFPDSGLSSRDRYFPPRQGLLVGETRSLSFASIPPIKTVDWHIGNATYTYSFLTPFWRWYM